MNFEQTLQRLLNIFTFVLTVGKVYILAFIAFALTVALLPLFDSFSTWWNFVWWHYRHANVMQSIVFIFIFFFLMKMVFFSSKNEDSEKQEKS